MPRIEPIDNLTVIVTQIGIGLLHQIDSLLHCDQATHVFIGQYQYCVHPLSSHFITCRVRFSKD